MQKIFSREVVIRGLDLERKFMRATEKLRCQ